MIDAAGFAVRLRSLFVAPGEVPPVEAVERLLPCPSVAVLAPAPEAPWLGAAVGIGVARAWGAPCALVCTWSAELTQPQGWAAPSPRAGRRLAARMTARGIEARAGGRIVRVSLCSEEVVAAAEATRALAAAADTPCVLAIGGPRGDALEALVSEQDHAMVFTRPDAPAGLAEIARAGLRALPADRVSSHVVAGGPGARVLALRGLSVGAGLRNAAVQAVA